MILQLGRSGLRGANELGAHLFATGANGELNLLLTAKRDISTMVLARSTPPILWIGSLSFPTKFICTCVMVDSQFVIL